nr:hypothetical protein [Tanacetum cinerariifolium]
GEGHMARQCTQPKRPRDVSWFKEKLMLAEAQESSQVLDEEQLAFLTDDLDAYDSDCDDISSAKAVLMANLSSYGLEVLSKAPQPHTYQNDNMLNQSVQETLYFKHSLIDYVPDNEISSDSNIISYEQYLQQTQNDKVNQETKIVNESLIAELERFKERVKTLEQRFNVDLNSHEKLIDLQMDDIIWNRCALKQEIDSLKRTLSNQVKEKESSLQTFNVFKKLKGNNVVEKDVRLNNPNVIALGMFKLDLVPLAPKLLNNRDAHIDYIKHSQKHADILQEIVKHARALRPLDSDLDSASKIVQRIQEVLVYIKDTCPSLTKPSKKLVNVTPLNKNKKVRIVEAATSSSTT